MVPPFYKPTAIRRFGFRLSKYGQPYSVASTLTGIDKRLKALVYTGVLTLFPNLI